MNDNRSNDDKRYNLESILYGYYIKYTTLDKLVDESFSYMGVNTNTVDVYIDIFDMLKHIYGKDIYANKQFVIVTAVINLAAHIRGYFYKKYRLWTRIFLVYADNSSINHKQFCPEFGDDSYKMTINYEHNTELINSQLDMVKILAAYIRDVYFIRKSIMFPVFVYDNILKNKSCNNQPVIITKNTFAYQILSFTKAILFRPKKYAGDDSSFYVHNSNVLKMYYHNVSNDKTLNYLSNINPEHLALLMTMTGNSQLNMYFAVSSTVAIRILYEAIESKKILNSYSSDPDYIYNNALPGLSKYIDIGNFKCRYNAFNLIYQHLLYTNMPESLDYQWNINLQDPNTVRDINNRYFFDNPLDLNNL